MLFRQIQNHDCVVLFTFESSLVRSRWRGWWKCGFLADCWLLSDVCQARWHEGSIWELNQCQSQRFSKFIQPKLRKKNSKFWWSQKISTMKTCQTATICTHSNPAHWLSITLSIAYIKVPYIISHVMRYRIGCSVARIYLRYNEVLLYLSKTSNY